MNSQNNLKFKEKLPDLTKYPLNLGYRFHDPTKIFSTQDLFHDPENIHCQWTHKLFPTPKCNSRSHKILPKPQ